MSNKRIPSPASVKAMLWKLATAVEAMLSKFITAVEAIWSKLAFAGEAMLPKLATAKEAICGKNWPLLWKHLSLCSFTEMPSQPGDTLRPKVSYHGRDMIVGTHHVELLHAGAPD